MINKQVRIHNGRENTKPILITTNHIGLKFGFFANSKKNGAYKGGAAK
jgi:ribosomal protein S19